jgi:HAD superfamily hydrolase (TIGR01509 family)
VSARWVVFDLIGVLAEPSWREVAKVDADKWRAFKLGQSAESAFWGAELAAAYRKVLSFRGDRLAYVRRLKARGQRVCLATNFSGEWLRDLLAKSGAAALFDARVVSAEIKAAKPDPAFFAEVRRYAPAGSIFVDDQEPNCAAATREGFQAIFAYPGCGVEEEVELRLAQAAAERA